MGSASARGGSGAAAGSGSGARPGLGRWPPPPSGPSPASPAPPAAGVTTKRRDMVARAPAPSQGPGRREAAGLEGLQGGAPGPLGGRGEGPAQGRGQAPGPGALGIRDGRGGRGGGPGRGPGGGPQRGGRAGVWKGLRTPGRSSRPAFIGVPCLLWDTDALILKLVLPLQSSTALGASLKELGNPQGRGSAARAWQGRHRLWEAGGPSLVGGQPGDRGDGVLWPGRRPSPSSGLWSTRASSPSGEEVKLTSRGLGGQRVGRGR